LVFVGDTPPGSPTAGQFWWDSQDGQLYIYYNDGTSSQWVPTTNVAALGSFLPLSGGTISGNLTVNGTTTHGSSVTVQNAGVLVGNAGTPPGQGGLVLNANAAAPPAAWTPASGLQITAADGVAAGLEVDAFGTVSPTLNLRQARGIATAQTASQVFDNLGIINFLGRDTSATGLGAQILGQTTQNWTTGAHGTEITFLTGALNGTTNPQVAIFRNDTGCQFYGTQTNDNAAAGWVGELLEGTASSSTNIPSGSWFTGQQLALTAGDWDVDGVLCFSPPTGGNYAACGVGLTLSVNAAPPAQQMSYLAGTFNTYYQPAPTRRISLSSTTNVCLNGIASFSGTAGVTSYMRARRVR